MDGDLLVRGGAVLGDALRPLDVLVQGGSIAAVGEGLDAPAGTEVLDAGGMLVLPGLINAHYHSGENFNPGLYENLPLDLWFVHSHQVTRAEPLSPEAIYARTALGAALMLRTGTTSCVDFLFEAPEITLATLEPVVQAYRDAGMRATILLGVADKPFAASLPLDDAAAAAAREAAPPTLDAIMALARDAVERWHEPGGQIGIGLGPSAPQRCTDALLDESLRFCRERGLAWQTHVLETKSQAFTSRRWHGKSFVERLAERGVLGPEATLVHTVWLSDRDIALMAAAGTPAVHCLMSNLRLGDGVARLPALRDAGVRVALGTDGRGCDETLDMLELAKMTALVHKARGGNFHRWPTAAQALEMCTAAASTCMGHGEALGRITPGALGDLVLLPLDTPALIPLHDPVRQVVYGSPSAAVRTVVVGGRVVVRDGDLVGLDVEQVNAQSRRYVADALAGDRPADAAALEALVEEMYAGIEAQSLDVDAYLRP
ncbi:MAG TPA: amidohydrolase family protein [Solirubrobacteraceae bacterium]|nr:amidohydrolase family protein [Solirubrobacteraceae bacterium]